MGLGSKLKKGWKRITNEAKDVYKQASNNLGDAEDSGLTTAAAQYFVNPLAYQNVAGSGAAGAYSRGADSRDAFAAGNANAGALASGDEQAWKDFAAFNAALVAGAAGGAMIAAPSALSIGGLTVGSVAGGSAAAATAGGLAIAGGLYGAYASQQDQTYNYDKGGGGSAPPDVASAYANDPDTSAQFNRLRKASRALGRAGTFKNKGSNTSLGLGDSVLGDQLSLIGS